jgi:cyclic pyranopterin phosphate synthase
MIDPFGRPITYLRVSVTDRCDFRCVYCMPEHMSFLPKADLLTLEELERLCGAFIAKGVERLRITGGEPLMRKNIMHLIDRLGERLGKGLNELTLTTNGSQLARYARDLAASGVRRINVSLDTLDADKFRAITRWGDLNKVLSGIDAAQDAGLKIKINTVALRDTNEDELAAMIGWAHSKAMDLALIETMPMGEIDTDRTAQYLPLSIVRGARTQVRADRHRLPDRRPRALRPYRRNWRKARVHHAPDPQFLRKLQSRARYLHGHTVHVPRSKRRRRSAHAFARIAR